MDPTRYAANLISKIGRQTPDSLKILQKAIGELLAGEGNNLHPPQFLGEGREGRAWDLSKNKIVKMSPDFYGNTKSPIFGEDLPGQLEGRLEPESVFPITPEASLHKFPKATVFDGEDFPDTVGWGLRPAADRMDEIREIAGRHQDPIKRKLARVAAAATLADDYDAFGRSPTSIFAKSYEPFDLASEHPFNIGHTPEQGYVAIDGSSGLVPMPAHVEEWEYPRQGYLIGKNILGRWTDEVLSPQTTNMGIGPVARRLLASHPREVQSFSTQ